MGKDTLNDDVGSVPLGFCHPFRKGWKIDASQVDELIHGLDIVKKEIAELREFEHALRWKMLDCVANSTAKTRRLIGTAAEVVLTMPSDYWNQSILKKCVNGYPVTLWSKYLRISAYAPNLREVKKLENAAGDEDLNRFRALLFSARSSGGGPPAAKIVKKGEVVDTDSEDDEDVTPDCPF